MRLRWRELWKNAVLVVIAAGIVALILPNQNADVIAVAVGTGYLIGDLGAAWARR